jgi:hypothetical protein
MRNWRKNHPGYHRDWQRRSRSGGARDGKAHKHIFGIRVGFSYFEPLRFVPKEQAEAEFLLLTQES